MQQTATTDSVIIFRQQLLHGFKNIMLFGLVEKETSKSKHIAFLLIRKNSSSYYSYYLSYRTGNACTNNLFQKPECWPVQQILFLKTHKTGSSIMANIFFRYGDVRDLRFVLSGGTLLGWPKQFRVTHPLRLYGHPDILCSHSRFNKKPMN